MSTFLSENTFSRLRLRQNMPYKDEVRASNLVLACNLMFLYSQYRLIGITHEQVINPLTYERASERACLLNANLTPEDLLPNGLNTDDVIDRYQDYQKLKDKMCDGIYIRKDIIDEWCKIIEASIRFPDFAIQKYFPMTSMAKAVYEYISGDSTYDQMKLSFEQSYGIITKDPMTGADVRRIFVMLKILLEKYVELLVDYDMAKNPE